MSLTTIAVFALGYLAVLVLVLSVLATAKRADERAQEEHDALVRSMTPEAPPHLASVDDLAHPSVLRRRTG